MSVMASRSTPKDDTPECGIAVLQWLRRFVQPRTRTRRTGGCDWDNLDIMDYVMQNEYLDPQGIGTFSVEGQVERVVVNGKSQMTAY